MAEIIGTLHCVLTEDLRSRHTLLSMQFLRSMAPLTQIPHDAAPRGAPTHGVARRIHRLLASDNTCKGHHPLP